VRKAFKGKTLRSRLSKPSAGVDEKYGHYEALANDLLQLKRQQRAQQRNAGHTIFGLNLRNPLVAGARPLNGDLDNIPTISGA
jgi:hypothetical protein